MKTKSLSFLAGISLATALTISCSILEEAKKTADAAKGSFASLTGNNLLQNSRAGFMSSNGEGVPDGDINVITNVEIGGNAIQGGSTLINITASQELDTLFVQIEGENGYYAFELEPEDKISTNPIIYQIALMFNTEIGEIGDEGLTPTITVSGKTKTGENVVPMEEELVIKKVGSGALQITLSWNNLDDVDLYVLNPAGDILFWNDRTSSNPNKRDSLDLDANAACQQNIGVNAENVYFEAPLDDGDYKVVVHLYERCTSGAGAKYNVTANAKGKFIDFAGKRQSGQFDDAEDGDKRALSSLPTSNTSTAHVIGTIKIANGEFVP